MGSRRVSWRLGAGVALAVASVAVGAQTPRAPAAGRLVIITSDLHLGPGKDPGTGQWLPIEDFRWPDEFAAFLRAIDEAGKGATDLVLNGDTFELWQSTGTECRQTDVRLGCTEPEALARLERVLAAHAAEMAALGAFARSGANRVVLVPGDHDAALLWPAVAQRVVAALKAPDRVEVATRGYWRSPDGAVYAEHGHQMAGDPYAFSSWPEPVVRTAGREHLERTAGEQVVQTLYNDLEPRYPVLDNFAQEGAGLKYLVAAEPTAFPANRVAPVLTFLLARPTWQQFRLDVDGGDVEPPEWDLEAVRKRGAAFFTESLLPDDRFLPLADQALKAGQLTLDPAKLTDQELMATCDYRAALRRSRRRLEQAMTQAPPEGRGPAECPRTPATRGSEFEYFWNSRDALFTGRLTELRTLSGDSAQPKVFVQGHVHLPTFAFVPMRQATSPIVLNSGAWQRTVTPFQIEEVRRERALSEADLLRQLQPEQLAACYGVVWIEPHAGNPSPRLRFWRSDARWGSMPRDAADIEGACPASGA